MRAATAALRLGILIAVVLMAVGYAGYRVWFGRPSSLISPAEHRKLQEQIQAERAKAQAEARARDAERAAQSAAAEEEEAPVRYYSGPVWYNPKVRVGETVEQLELNLPDLLEALDSDVATDRVMAVTRLLAFARVHGNDAIAAAKPKFLKMVDAEEDNVRAAAVAGLAFFPGSLTRKQLARLGRDECHPVYEHVLQYLENSATDRDTAYLAELVRFYSTEAHTDEDTNVQYRAAAALQTLMRIGARTKRLVAAAVLGCSEATQKVVIYDMADANWSDSIAQIGADDSFSPQVRTEAAMALRTLDPMGSYELFEQMATSEDEEVRDTAQSQMSWLKASYPDAFTGGVDF